MAHSSNPFWEHSTATNNRDDITEAAEGLGQESEMHRFVFACLVLALMAQGAGAEGQTTSSEIDCIQETEYSITPDVVQNNEVFHLVVIGDSIAWGAGLEKEEKYSFLVTEWLSKQLERQVNVKILAHTGATIGDNDDPVALSPDLSSGSPTLMEQADSISDSEHVDLILVSGGINDVTVDNIIKLDHLVEPSESTLYYMTPDLGREAWDSGVGWLSTCSEADLRQKTREIKPLMRDLLNKLITKCPNAAIVVTGYYPIISVKSTGLTETIRTLMPNSQFISDYQNLDNPIEKSQLSEKSEAFYDESTKSLTAAVQETSSRRVAFAGIEFNPENCYGTGESFLWRIESGQTRTDDPLYECRVSLVGDGNGDKDRINKVAAVGHPNEKGAGLYFSALKEELEKISPEFLPLVEDFSIASPATLALGESFEFNYVVSDKGELGLKQVELWRKDESSDWQQINTNPLAGETGPLSGSFTDSPTAPGKYWYGMHVVDNAGNWNDEGNSNSDGQPSSFEPVEVEVIEAEPTKPTAVDETFGSANSDLALKGDIYYLEEGARSLPDFAGLTPIGTIYADVLDIPSRSFDSGFPGVTERFEWFAIRYIGASDINLGGEYAFRLLSDDGSRLIIDGVLIIDNDGQHSPKSVSGEVYLTPGQHSIEVDYFQGPRNDIALQLFWTPPGESESIFDGKGKKQLADSTPTVQSFQVAPLGLTAGESFLIDYTVSDIGGSGLKQVELWRKDEASDWQEIKPPNTLAGEIGPISGSFTDSPPAPGKYWYGVHVVDNAGNWNDQKNSNTNGQPSGFEPAEVEVEEAAIVEDSSQAPSEEWTKTYGGPGEDMSASVQQTTEGGYILAGNTQSYGAGGKDGWLIKTDTGGNQLWTKTFGGPGDDAFASVQQTSDRGYVTTGETSSNSADGTDVLLIKTNAEGDQLWTRTFGGSKNDAGASVQQTTDGGYIIAGFTFSYGAGGADVWLIKTDSEGNQLWAKTFGGSDQELGFSVRQTADDGYIITGDTFSYGAGEDMWLIKTDAEGNQLWTKTFGGVGQEVGTSAQQITDGGYIIMGITDSYGAGGWDVWLVKTDAEGNQIWTKTFGGSGQEMGISGRQTSDDGYILSGMTINGLNRDRWLIKTDAEGNKIWTKTFGGSSDDTFASVQQTYDGSYILTGCSSGDVWLIKVASS